MSVSGRYRASARHWISWRRRRLPPRGIPRLMSYSSGRQRCGRKTSRRASTPLRRSALTCAQPVPARLTGRWRTRPFTEIASPLVSVVALKRSLRRAARAARHPRRVVDSRRIRSEFVSRFLGGDHEALRRYEREVDESGLRPHLFAKAREQQALV